MGEVIQTKKIMKALSVGALVMGVSYSAVPEVQAASFTYGSGVPDRSSANKKGVYPLMDKIAKATDNRVTFKRLVGGTVVKLTKTMPAIADGVVDSGFMISQFYPADLPYASLLGALTGLGTDPYATIGALNEIYFTACPECQKDFNKKGLYPLFIQSADPIVMQCTKKISSPADLKGLKVSHSASPEARWAETLGMTPVRSRISDILSALQLGQTNCVLAPLAWMRSYGFADSIKSVIDYPQGVITGAVPLVMGKKAWGAISAKDKEAIKNIMPGAIFDYVHDAYVLQTGAVKKSVEKRINFSSGGEQLAKMFKAYSAKEKDALIALAKKRKLANGEELVNKMAAIMEKWHTVHLPKIQGNREGFAKVLKAEVFDKVSY